MHYIISSFYRELNYIQSQERREQASKSVFNSILSGIHSTEAGLKEKHGVWDPMLELDEYDLIIS